MQMQADAIGSMVTEPGTCCAADGQNGEDTHEQGPHVLFADIDLN